jgi:hypothetical protein
MQNTLGLDDDLDPVEAVAGLEKAFALKISDDEAVACKTVGDIYDLLHARFAEQMGTGGACVTSMAFYRLRKALRRMHPEGDFRPSTSLTQCTGSNARSFLRQLGQDSALQVPGPQGRWVTAIGCLLLVGALLAVVLATINRTPVWILTAVGLVVVGIALVRLDPGVLPDDCTTLGGLATKVSALNFGKFALSGAAVRADGLWVALTEVLSEWSDIPRAEIRRDTFVLQAQLDAARSSAA